MIFFYGSPFGNNGPAQVNKTYVKVLPKRVLRIRYRNRYLMRLEILCKILCSRTIILSALGQKTYETRIAKILGKKIIYIMHGFAKDDGPLQMKLEADILPKADLILCVSDNFKKLAQEEFPRFAKKMETLANGIDWSVMPIFNKEEDLARKKNRIILIGGGRPIKKNLNICKAVEKLNCRGYQFEVELYGNSPLQKDIKVIENFPFVTCYGFVTHETLMARYKEAYIFAQISTSESFGLSVIEALASGCNILVSDGVGAKAMFKPKSEEIVMDCDDIEEIEHKLLNLYKNPNRDRLISNIDKDESSAQYAINKLINFAERI